MSTHVLLTLTWWTAAGQRAAYTALAALLPLAALLVAGDVTTTYVILVVALALAASLVTSLAGLPEVAGRDVPIWLAVVVRVTKTGAQTLAASLGGAVLLTDVDWKVAGTAVAGAALTTLVRTLMTYLPETPSPDAGDVAIVSNVTVNGTIAPLPGKHLIVTGSHFTGTTADAIRVDVDAKRQGA